ncbi:OmpA family protein [Tindallia californiensis]|uniref:Chemotaxis protein MotB n=1 Tax=Tindallia californiensis TaxID=159292 RepID=A0A1H3JMQ9_9FIRM|nr:OmpA family protein [Tindallia californiensis]SDY40524.1 chemotaxis protein MotB [Tindallia californiensis]
MKIRRRNFRKQSEAENFWPSFTDIISTIALVLFFLMLLAYIQNIISGKNLEFAEQQVIDTQRRLEQANVEISQAEDNLRLIEDRLEEVKAEVEAGEIALQLSEEQIEEQREIIAESNRELGDLRTRLESVAVLRLDVLERVKTSIETELGSATSEGDPLVSIAANGNIIINEGLVFDYNSATVKREGIELLDQLAIAFERVLDDRSTRNNIDAISIQGHTDNTGSAEYNRDLSTRRATSVVNHMMNANPNLERKYADFFAATGYSEFRPIASNRTASGRSQNRRIEISIILKDDQVQNIIETYLEDSMDIFE